MPVLLRQLCSQELPGEFIHAKGGISAEHGKITVRQLALHAHRFGLLPTAPQRQVGAAARRRERFRSVFPVPTVRFEARSGGVQLPRPLGGPQFTGCIQRKAQGFAIASRQPRRAGDLAAVAIGAYQQPRIAELHGGLTVFVISPGDPGLLHLYALLAEQPLDEFVVAFRVAQVDACHLQGAVGQPRHRHVQARDDDVSRRRLALPQRPEGRYFHAGAVEADNVARPVRAAQVYAPEQQARPPATPFGAERVNADGLLQEAAGPGFHLVLVMFQVRQRQPRAGDRHRRQQHQRAGEIERGVIRPLTQCRCHVTATLCRIVP